MFSVKIIVSSSLEGLQKEINEFLGEAMLGFHNKPSIQVEVVDSNYVAVISYLDTSIR